jgi:hypothetical protein
MGRQVAYRVLASAALVEPPGVHHQAVYLDRAVGAGQFGELHAGAAERQGGLAPDRPARQHRHPGQSRRVFLSRDAAEGIVRQAERGGQAGALAVAALRPRLGEHHDVGAGAPQGLDLSPRLPGGPPGNPAVSPARKEKRMPRSSIKDEKKYQALRDEGASQEKAARIANAGAASSPRKVAAKGGRSGSYDDWSKADLLSRAREIGIRGRSSMSKKQLIDALRNH